MPPRCGGMAGCRVGPAALAAPAFPHLTGGLLLQAGDTLGGQGLAAGDWRPGTGGRGLAAGDCLARDWRPGTGAGRLAILGRSRALQVGRGKEGRAALHCGPPCTALHSCTMGKE